MTTLNQITTPKSIAIVGASDDKNRIGGRPLSHMIEQKFEGTVYPVNPNREKVQGLKTYPNLQDIPGDLDFVLIAVPAKFVVNVIEDAVKKLGIDWDIEVLETHHNKKIDSPSGTAFLIGDTAAKARNQNLKEVMNISRNGIIGQRQKEEIGFAVLRGGDVVGEHSIRFYNSNERIEINHIATNRSIFAKGAIRSAIWACGTGPGFFSLKDVIKYK